MNTGLIKIVLGQSNVAHLQSGVLIVFLLMFLMIMLWIYWPGSKTYYDKIASDLLKGE